jgi:DNA invertase Pin-like site-specific DNA recombinase
MVGFFVPEIYSRMRGMIYGYARVSTETQDLTSQLVQLKAAGCKKTFREKITGWSPTTGGPEKSR